MEQESETQYTELRGDISTYGFWKDRRTTIFDVRVTDTDAPSHQNRDPKKVLATQELTKRNLYELPCRQRRRDFTPLVFSIDGLMGQQAISASRQLARKLSKNGTALTLKFVDTSALD